MMVKTRYGHININMCTEDMRSLNNAHRRDSVSGKEIGMDNAETSKMKEMKRKWQIGK